MAQTLGTLFLWIGQSTLRPRCFVILQTANWSSVGEFVAFISSIPFLLLFSRQLKFGSVLKASLSHRIFSLHFILTQLGFFLLLSANAFCFHFLFSISTPINTCCGRMQSFEVSSLLSSPVQFDISHRTRSFSGSAEGQSVLRMQIYNSSRKPFGCLLSLPLLTGVI